jgi:hypothetical protein
MLVALGTALDASGARNRFPVGAVAGERQPARFRQNGCSGQRLIAMVQARAVAFKDLVQTDKVCRFSLSID